MHIPGLAETACIWAIQPPKNYVGSDRLELSTLPVKKARHALPLSYVPVYGEVRTRLLPSLLRRFSHRAAVRGFGSGAR